jgi:hypothetical protein
MHLHGHHFHIINKADYAFTVSSYGGFLMPFDNPINPCETELGGNIVISDPNFPGRGTPDFPNTYWGCAYNETNHKRTELQKPIMRDLVSVFRRSWVVLRVRLDNPGVHVFHCHVTPHSIGGLMIAFNVRPDDQLPVPAHVPSSGECPKWNDECQLQSLERCSSIAGCAATKDGCRSFPGTCDTITNKEECKLFDNICKHAHQKCVAR